MTQSENICPGCGAAREAAAEAASLGCCPACGRHFRLEPAARIAYLADEGSWRELAADMHSGNPIGMAGYEEKLRTAQEATGLNEAIVTGECTIEGRPALLGAMSFRFLGGSMGSVVGEKVARLFFRAIEKRLPVIIFATSGGARMQEGAFSLLQMAKTANAAALLDKAGLLFISVLCDPTTGGVSASFSTLADIIVAEPGALVGFAGPRVIEGTIHAKLPDGFQRAEFQEAHGFVDAIVARKDQKSYLAHLLDLHGVEAIKS